MSYALNIKHGDLEVDMIPGVLREGAVKVGLHIPPSGENLNAYFNEFEYLYNPT